MITNKKTDEAWNNLYTRIQVDGLLEESKPAVRLPIRHRTTTRWVTAAVTVLCLCAGAVFLYQLRTLKAKTPLLTLSNENKEATLVSTLEDGSTVYLSKETFLRYPEHFEKEKREVYLEGDAFFDIYHDRNAPFFIETDEVRVEVLGTAFSIQNIRNKPFRLAVERGKVLITRKKDGVSTQVQAGQMVIIDLNHMQKQIHESAIFFKYKSRIYFKDEKLPDLIRVINQCADGPEIQLGRGLENRRLNYAYVNDSTLAVTKIICLALGLRYELHERTILILPQ